MFFVNTDTGLLHNDGCEFAAMTKPENQRAFATDLEAFDLGYRPCTHCILRTRHPGRVYASTRRKRFQQQRADAFLNRKVAEGDGIEPLQPEGCTLMAEAGGFEPPRPCGPLR